MYKITYKKLIELFLVKSLILLVREFLISTQDTFIDTLKQKIFLYHL